MKVGLFTPTGPLYEGEAQRVAAVSVTGAFEVLEGHAPFVAALASAPLRILTPEGEKNFPLQGGFLWVSPEGEVRILAKV